MSRRSGQGTALGERLRQLREVGGLTQEELAARARLTAKGIAAIERGRSRRPLPQTLRALAAALGLGDGELRARFALASGQQGALGETIASPAPVTPVANHSPTPLTPLIGRDTAIATVSELFVPDGARLVTRRGRGGVGKTRMALAVASAVARALGLQEGNGRPLRELLHAWARARHALLILDNLEHLLGATPELAALLTAGPQLAILATSRAPLRLQGEQEWLVPPLAIPQCAAVAIESQSALRALATIPAVRLFIERSNAVLPDFALTCDNAATIAAICRRLDGLPLALELAAARLRVLPPAVLLDRLDAALPLLTGGARDLPMHQRTMRDTIAWSYTLLSPAEQRLLRRLGPFVGGWTLAAAEAVFAAPGADKRCLTTSEQPTFLHGIRNDDRVLPCADDALGSLSELVEQSLVVTLAVGDEQEVRYRFLEPIRQFALEQLVAHGEVERAHAAHAAHFLTLAKEAELGLFGAEQARVLAHFEMEHANLRAALDWFLTQGMLDEAVRLGWLLHRFWWIRGHLTVGRQWRAAILPQRERLPPAMHALALLTAAFLTYAEGDHVTTGALLDEGLPLIRTVDHPVLLTLTLGLGGLAALGRGEGPRAREQLTEALAVAKGTGDHWDIGMMQNFLGYVALTEGDDVRAHALLAEAERSWRISGSHWDLAVNLNMRSALAEWRGDNALAEALTRESMALLKPLGDTWVSVYALGQLAGVAISRGQFIHAARLLGATDQLRDTTGTTILFASDRALNERRLIALRAALSEAELATAWAAGQRLTLPQALAEADDTIGQV